jgi:hypothetical protein
MLVLLGCSPQVAQAQLAADIARGSTADEVIRLHGWPKGRSTTEGREVWMYDRFQVLFENGRAVQVTPLAPTKHQPAITSQPPTEKKSSPAPPRSSVNQSPAPAGAARPGPASTSSSPQRSTPPAPRPAGAEPRHPAPPTLPGVLLRTLWPVALILIAGGALHLLIVRRQRKMKLPACGAASQTSEIPKARGRGWETEIANRLAQAQNHMSSSMPPPLPGLGLEAMITLDLLRRLEWKRFEQLVVLYYRETGVRAACTRIGADGGVDVYLYRGGEGRPYGYVQCKAWNVYRVGVKPVRELFGAISAEGVQEGVFVTSGDYTAEAREFAAGQFPGGRKLTLLTGNELLARIQALPVQAQERVLQTVTAGDYTTPTCPRCDVKMVLRDNRKDDSRFWGCPRYPRCQHTFKANERVEV